MQFGIEWSVVTRMCRDATSDDKSMKLLGRACWACLVFLMLVSKGCMRGSIPDSSWPGQVRVKLSLPELWEPIQSDTYSVEGG